MKTTPEINLGWDLEIISHNIIIKKRVMDQVMVFKEVSFQLLMEATALQHTMI